MPDKNSLEIKARVLDFIEIFKFIQISQPTIIF
jgi:predicted DNA-binding transcriptional regulator AlpA